MLTVPHESVLHALIAILCAKNSSLIIGGLGVSVNALCNCMLAKIINYEQGDISAFFNG